MGATRLVSRGGSEQRHMPHSKGLAIASILALFCIATHGRELSAQSASPIASARGEIVGTVTTSGIPATALTITLVGVTQTQSDSAGGYRFLDLAPGTYFLSVKKLGSDPVLKNISVEAGTRVRVDVALESGAQSLKAVVTSPNSSVAASFTRTGRPVSLVSLIAATNALRGWLTMRWKEYQAQPIAVRKPASSAISIEILKS